ncbi:MAG: hypothetical protein HZA48_05535 [Planctomycetes bacterium]|nr:hypothetical protein [Planctomycetota bacterium]
MGDQENNIQKDNLPEDTGSSSGEELTPHPPAYPRKNMEYLFINARYEKYAGSAYNEELIEKNGIRRFLTLDLYLKDRASIFKNIVTGGHLRPAIFNSLLAAIVISFIYGAVMGFFAGGAQVLYSALKFPIAVVACYFICLPTFYIFSSILSSRYSIAQSMAILLCMTVPAVLLLLGFAPIVWFFSISTGTAGFMFLLHGIVFAIATAFGILYLYDCVGYINYISKGAGDTNMAFLNVWMVIYLTVQCQLLSYLGPFISAGEKMFIFRKGFFTEALKGIF